MVDGFGGSRESYDWDVYCKWKEDRSGFEYLWWEMIVQGDLSLVKLMSGDSNGNFFSA